MRKIPTPIFLLYRLILDALKGINRPQIVGETHIQASFNISSQYSVSRRQNKYQMYLLHPGTVIAL